MAIGGGAIGAMPIGGALLPGAAVTTSTLAHLAVATTAATLRESDLILQFFDVAYTGGDLHLVAWSDNTPGQTAGEVAFDGETYSSVVIARTDISESTLGEIPEISITLADPTRAIVAFCKANDPTGAIVTLRAIRYADLATPSLAIRTFRFQLRRIRSVEPAAVVAELGPPPIFDQQFPRILFSRDRCPNDYQKRFDHENADEPPLCIYPSDEFELQTAQKLYTTSIGAGEVQFAHGWYVVNADEVANDAGPTFESGYKDTRISSTNRVLRINYGGSGIKFDDSTFNAPYVYKKIGADSVNESTDIDVQTQTWKGPLTDEDRYHYGILVQDADDLDQWIFWGAALNASSVSKCRARVTTAGTSAESDYDDSPSGSLHNAFRLVRSGSTWSCYSRTETPGGQSREPTNAWTLRGTETLSMSGTINVGLVAGSNTLSTAILDIDFFHFRFLAGGYATCDRSLTGTLGCNAHANGIQFNAEPLMPTRLR